MTDLHYVVVRRSGSRWLSAPAMAGYVLAYLALASACARDYQDGRVGLDEVQIFVPDGETDSRSPDAWTSADTRVSADASANRVTDIDCDNSTPADEVEHEDVGMDLDAGTNPDVTADAEETNDTAVDSNQTDALDTQECKPTKCSPECPCTGSQDGCVDGACVCQPNCSGECGQDGCGGYCTPCAIGWDGYFLHPHWTLCDETTQGCVLPQPDCYDGWCRIPAASFLAGGELDGATTWDTWPWYPAVITRPFEIQATEATQAQWMTVMAITENPSPYAACGPDCPISGMTFYDVLVFANRLSEAAGLTPCFELVGCNDYEPGHGLLLCDGVFFAGPDCEGYRLPTEAEWDLAAGAGADTCFPHSEPDVWVSGCDPNETLASIAWFCGNSQVAYSGCLDCSEIGAGLPTCCGPHPVGQKDSNPFGLFDTSGNLYELNWTVFESPYQKGLEVDPGYVLFIGSDDWASSRGGAFRSKSTIACTRIRRPEPLGKHAEAPGFPETNGFHVANTGFRLARTLLFDP